MDIIKITHKRYSIGFGKPEQIQHDGVRFPNGKIAYMDENDIIRSCESEQNLQKALVDAKIEKVRAKR